MSIQSALRSLLGELLDDGSKDRGEEAPEAWAALEKFARCWGRFISVLVWVVPVMELNMHSNK